MIQIYLARDAMDAHFLQGLLADEGIESVIQGEAMDEVWGSVALSEVTRPTIWINEANLAVATPIVDEYETRRRDSVAESRPEKPTWTCATCGEKCEEQFTSCWHCNTPRSKTTQPE